MKPPKMSTSPVTQAIRADIWQDIDALGIDEVRRYMREFPREVDYNIAQYGNLRVYYADIRQMYVYAGAEIYGMTYKRATREHERGEWRKSNGELWGHYLAQVRHVADAYAQIHSGQHSDERQSQ